MAKANNQNIQKVTCTKAGAAVLSSRWYLDNSNYKQRNGNKLTPYFSGQEVFAAIAKSINEAQKSIDIVCWGFDPAMPIIREGSNWEWKETDSYGHHLIEAATGSKPVKIRLLLWYTQSGNGVMENAPGLPASDIPFFSRKEAFIRNEIKLEDGTIKTIKTISRENGSNDKTGGRAWSPEATAYSRKWFEKIERGEYPNIEVVFREMNNLNNLVLKNEDPRSFWESLSLNVPSDHQKSLLVDYGTDQAHGYVMGHNSLTAYWDTVEMRHDEPLREAGLEPWHDFSIGIKGSALIDLNANFCESWDDNCQKNYIRKGYEKITESRKGYEKITESRTDEKTEKKMNEYCDSNGSSVQLVRTRPDKKVNGDKELEIRRAYFQVAENPRRYVLIVNQYFQYASWVREVKQYYKKYLEKLGALNSESKPMLYVFAFTAQPEKTEMMFRTHQMANELGVSDQVGQGKNGDNELYRQDKDGNYHMTMKGALNGAEMKHTYEELKKNGIETVFCNLKTQVDGEPQDIYIHAKLMVIDDDFFTLGSANLNFRSMTVDSELNLLCDDERVAYQFRKTLLERYNGGLFWQPVEHAIMDVYFGKFKNLIEWNQENMRNKRRIIGHAVPFLDERSVTGSRRA